MRSLELALYCEGPTDQLFLSIIIQRSSRKILEQYKQGSINISRVETIKINKTGLRRDECVFQAASKAAKYHVLIVHADADHPTREKALLERFQPGYRLVQQAEEKICKNLLPIIPVRMTEAWMLADHEAMQDVLETALRVQELGLPSKARQVESDPDPKHTLRQIMQRACAERSRRHRAVDLRSLYAPLARRINLERLGNVPSYKQFVKDLTETLKILNLVE